MRPLSMKKSESVAWGIKPLKPLARVAALSTGLKAAVNEGKSRATRARDLQPISLTPAFKPVPGAKNRHQTF